MSVEVLYFDGCPSPERLLRRLREIVAEAGGDPDQIALRRVDTLEDAVKQRFLGSPTVRVDGRDVDPTADARHDFGLKCRLYHDERGQSPLPPEPWIRRALEPER